MGDPTSPGMTVGACAWMERAWLQSLPAAIRCRLVAKRFMDDILLIYAESPDWDSESMLTDFTTNCYTHPLSLEDAKDDTFLESTFAIKNNKLEFWLKNDNTTAEPHKVWRYQHFDSATPFTQKRAVMSAAMQKVHRMASDVDALHSSAVQKLAEFARLQYPRGLLRQQCSRMATVTQTFEWIKIRDKIMTWFPDFE